MSSIKWREFALNLAMKMTGHARTGDLSGLAYGRCCRRSHPRWWVDLGRVNSIEAVELHIRVIGAGVVRSTGKMGHEYCGIVQEVDSEVASIKPGRFVSRQTGYGHAEKWRLS